MSFVKPHPGPGQKTKSSSWGIKWFLVSRCLVGAGDCWWQAGRQDPNKVQLLVLYWLEINISTPRLVSAINQFLKRPGDNLIPPVVIFKLIMTKTRSIIRNVIYRYWRGVSFGDNNMELLRGETSELHGSFIKLNALICIVFERFV